MLERSEIKTAIDIVDQWDDDQAGHVAAVLMLCGNEIVSQRKQIEALTAQVGVLREALERSGHNIGCARNHFSSVCTCGLNEALAATPEAALSEVRKAEREKCAKVCEQYDERIESMRDADYQAELAGRQAGAMRCAAAIRAMGDE